MRHQTNGGLRVYRGLDWMGDSAISLVSPQCLSFLFIFTSLHSQTNSTRHALLMQPHQTPPISHVALLPLRHRESVDSRQSINRRLRAAIAARSGGAVLLIGDVPPTPSGHTYCTASLTSYVLCMYLRDQRYPETCLALLITAVGKYIHTTIRGSRDRTTRYNTLPR